MSSRVNTNNASKPELGLRLEKSKINMKTKRLIDWNVTVLFRAVEENRCDEASN